MKKTIIHIIPDLGVGGAEKLMIDICSNLDKEVFTPIIVSLYAKKETIYHELINKNHIRVIYLNKKRGIDLSIIIKLINIYKKERPHVINTHLYSVVYALLPLIFYPRIKIFHTVHNIAQKELSFLGKCIMKIVYKFGRVTPIAISYTIKKTISEYYNIKEYKIPCVINGIDTKKFKSSTVGKKDKEKITFINVARFTDQKNHELLLRSFKTCLDKYKNLNLILVGDGPKYEEMKQLANNLGISKNVKFLGVSSDISYHLSKADIFICSSKWEGLPLSILEAMSVGLAIISTDVGGVKDIVLDNGILVPNNDEKELVNAILYLISNPSMIEKMSYKSIKYSKKYDIGNTALDYQKLYLDGIVGNA